MLRPSQYLGRLTQMKTKIGDFSYNYIGTTPLLQDIQVPNGNDVTEWFLPHGDGVWFGS